ncbi:putative methyltransferase-domain-containing protein [Kalaharituber pfeilii]|nr:putative methyltransferase-domain-containing protein [Kalaharituber pfeilii]
MPLYIRFVKTPRCSLSQTARFQSLNVSALITITSDLGESFYPNKATLRSELLVDPDPNSIYQDETHVLNSTRVKWIGGYRNVRVEMNVPIPSRKFPWKRDCKLVLKVISEEPRIADKLLEHGQGHELGIVSAWSAPFAFPQAGENTVAEHFVERRLQLSQSRCLRIWEETGDSIARHIWDGGFALSAYLAQYYELRTGSLTILHQKLQQTNNLKIVELGSGSGIVGLTLTALKSNCRVLLTDLESAEEVVQRNLECSQTQWQGVAAFQVFDWNDSLPPSQPPDIILVADCTYNPDSAALLVQAMRRCVSGSRDTIVVLAHKKRHESETLFFDLICKSFEIVQQSRTEMGATLESDVYPGMGTEVVDIYIFRLLAE